jgi:hypothetical protein
VLRRWPPSRCLVRPRSRRRRPIGIRLEPRFRAPRRGWAGPIELADGRPVLYSLGNLIFDLTRSEETVEGVIVEITFVGARPAQIRLHPTVMVDLVQPNFLDPAGDGAVVIKRIRVASEELAEP